MTDPFQIEVSASRRITERVCAHDRTVHRTQLRGRGIHNDPKVFERALDRAKIATGDVTVHTLRDTALSRMIEHGLDDYTVMSISRHSSTRMRERSTHPSSNDG